MKLIEWVRRACTSAGAAPRIGARLAPILRQAGLQTVTTFGVQAYLQPDDPAAVHLLGPVVRSLASGIVASGIATTEQLALDSLEARISDALQRADAVFLPPTVAGAWGRSPAAGSH